MNRTNHSIESDEDSPTGHLSGSAAERLRQALEGDEEDTEERAAPAENEAAFSLDVPSLDDVRPPAPAAPPHRAAVVLLGLAVAALTVGLVLWVSASLG